MKKSTLAMRFFINFVTTLAVGMFFTSTLAATKNNSVKQNEKNSLMFVLQGQGTITNDKKAGNFKLILNKKNTQIIWFTNRPFHKAGHMQIVDFIKVWNQGKNSFKKNPPTAVTVAEDRDPTVVVLTSMQHNENPNALVFYLHTLNNAKLSLARNVNIKIFMNGLPCCPGIICHWCN